MLCSTLDFYSAADVQEYQQDKKVGMVKENGKWFYYDSKGDKVKNTIVEIDKNCNHYFAENGLMRSPSFESPYSEIKEV